MLRCLRFATRVRLELPFWVPQVFTTTETQRNCPVGSGAPDLKKKCKNPEACTDQECCVTNAPCHGATTLLAGAANMGTCKSTAALSKDGTLASGKSCLQVGKVDSRIVYCVPSKTFKHTHTPVAPLPSSSWNV